MVQKASLLLTLFFFASPLLIPLTAQEEYKTQELLEKINQWFEDGAVTVTSLARNPVFIEQNVVEIKAAFKESMERNPEIINIFYGAAEGYFRLNSLDTPLPKSFDYKARPWFYKAMAMRDLIYTEPYIDINTRDSVVTIATPVRSEDGKLHGVVGADILVNSIVNLMNDKSQEIKNRGKPNLIFIMNSQGDELVSSFQSVTNGFVKKIDNREYGIFRTDNMLTNFVRFFRLKGVPWYLLEFTSNLNSNFLEVYRTINQKLADEENAFLSHARREVFRGSDRGEISSALRNALANLPDCLNVVYCGVENDLYLEGRKESQPGRTYYRTLEWFIRTRNSKAFEVSKKSLDPVTKKQIYTLAWPIQKEGRVQAVVAADFQVNPLIDSLKQAQNLCCLMDTEGHIVLSRNSDTMKNLVVDKIAWQKKYRFKEEVESNGVRSCLEFNRIHLPGWFLILQDFGAGGSSE